MTTEYKTAADTQKENFSDCRRVWLMIADDPLVKSRTGGSSVQLTHDGKALRCAPQVVDMVLALRADGQSPQAMTKRAVLSFGARFLLSGGLQAFRTRDGKEVSRPVPVEEVVPKEAVAVAVPMAVAVAVKAAPVKAAPVKAAEAVTKVPVVPKARESAVAQVKVAPAILTAVPLVRDVAAEPEPEPEPRQRREPVVSESFCASIVLSHLLITAAQLGAYDTDPGFEQRNAKLNTLLAEYQKIAEARITNWPKLPKLAHGKPV